MEASKLVLNDSVFPSVAKSRARVYRCLSPARDLSHALNYKRVWRGGLAEVISLFS